MNYKKSFIIFLGLLLVSSLAISIVSAADTTEYVPISGQGIEAFLQGAVNVVSPFTAFVFGANKSLGDNGFVALMAFLLTILVIVGVLTPIKIFGDKGWINLSIAIIVALIGIRFVPIEMLKSFTIPAEGLMGALFLIIPFLIAASLALKVENTYIRRILWAIYAVIMITLLAYHWGQADSWNSFYWVYVAIILACIFMFAIDGTIKRFIQRTKTEYQRNDAEERASEAALREETSKRIKLEEQIAQGQLAQEDAAKESLKLREERAALKKTIKNLRKG